MAAPCLFTVDLIEHSRDLILRRWCQQADNHVEEAADQESRKQFIDIKRASQFRNTEFPDKDHDTAGDHTGERTPFIGSSPEQCQKNDGAEGCAEARPSEGYDPEDGAVRIFCEEDPDHGDGDHSAPCDGHRSFFLQLYAEEILHDILGDAGGGSQKLGVRRGHGGSQNTRHDHACDQRRKDAESAQITGDLNDDRLGILQSRDHARLRHAVSDDTDQDGNRHGDHNPYAGNSSGQEKFFLIFDRHEAKQYVGHAKIPEPPCESGNDGQGRVRGSAAGGCHIGLCKAQISGQCFRIFDNCGGTACLYHAEADHDKQCDRHDDALDQVGGAYREEAAEGTVGYDDNGRDDHGNHIVHAEQCAEQFTAGGKAGCRIGDKEDDDDHRRDGCQDILFVAITFCKEIRYGDRSYRMGIPADLFRDYKPVQISAGSQSDHGPADIGKSGKVSQPGKPHQQITAHVGCLRAHGGNEGPEGSSA